MNNKNCVGKNKDIKGGFFMLFRHRSMFENLSDVNCKKMLLTMFDYYQKGEKDFGGNRSLEMLFDAVVRKPILDKKGSGKQWHINE